MPSVVDTDESPDTSRVAPGAWPLIGHIPAFVTNKLDFLLNAAQSCGDVARLDIRGPIWLLNNPDDTGYVLAGNRRNYIKTDRITGPDGRRIWGNSLIVLSDPAEHLARRRTVQPSFNAAAISGFADIMASCTADMLDRWRDGEVRDIRADMTELALRINGKILFGIDLADDDNAAIGDALILRREYIESVFLSPLPFADKLPTSAVRGYPAAQAVIAEVIWRRMSELRGDESGATLLGMLIHARDRDGVGLTDDELFDEVLTLAVAGYETIAEMLSWTFHLLARNADIFESVGIEADRYAGARPMEYDDIARLELAENVINESLRLYPPTWIYLRTAIDADTLPSGARIPAGGKIYISPWVLHRNPLVFPDPLKFDPSRFETSTARNRPKFAYVPFGGGPRACVAQALSMMTGVLVVASISRRFSMNPVAGDVIRRVPGITLRPAGAVRMTLHARTPTTEPQPTAEGLELIS